MCDPTVLAAASFVSSAGSTIMGAGAQNAQARGVAGAALRDYRLRAVDLGIRQGEENVAASLDIGEAIRATAVGKGATQAAAGEGNVTGGSVTALSNVLQGQLGEATMGILRNRDSVVAQLQREKLAARAEATSRIAGAPPASPLATAVGVANAGLSFGNYMIGRPRGAEAPKVVEPSKTPSYRAPRIGGSHGI